MAMYPTMAMYPAMATQPGQHIHGNIAMTTYSWQQAGYIALSAQHGFFNSWWSGSQGGAWSSDSTYWVDTCKDC